MRRSLDLYFKMISIQVRSQMQYRVSFLLETFSTILLSGSYVLVVLLALDRFGGVAGWSIGEVAFLAGMVETSFGFMDMIFSGYDPGSFSPMVQQGLFDQLLLRPVNITLQVLGSKFMLRRLGRIFEGLLVLILGLIFTQIHWTLGKALYLPVVLISQVICFGALFIAGSTLTFWTVQPVEAVNIVTYGGVEFVSYPMSIYPQWVLRIFTYVIPFIFINYYPALYFLDKPDPFNFPSFSPFLAPGAALVMLLAALWFWRFGVNHYHSTGS